MLVILKWVRIRGMVILEMLAPNHLATKILLVADDHRELIAVCLCPSVHSLVVFFSDLTSVLGLRLMVYIVQIYLDDLSSHGFGRLFDKGKAFHEGPVLEA
jgi:hypothetical protein